MNHPERLPLASVSPEREAIQQWLDRLNHALDSRKAAELRPLFAPDSHWRDLLAYTWTIAPHHGAEAIAEALARHQARALGRHFRISETRLPPRQVVRLGRQCIEAIIEFDTMLGKGSGIVRLLADQPDQAWVFHTALDELTGYEERTGKRRPGTEPYSRNFGGDNWQDQRDKSQAYTDREPAVLIVGAGQAGLSLAARLRQLGVDALVIDKHERVGDNWRKRYHSLSLHNQIHVNHLPYMPFPPTWPKYIPKDMLGHWFEAYTWAMEINVWCGTEFTGGSFDETAHTWTVNLKKADGSTRTLHPRHLVLANGVSGIARIPDLPGLKDFKGEVMHSDSFKNGSRWRGKNALVLGTGTSAHDVAQDLHSNGVQATLIQRGSSTVVSIDPSAALNYALYAEGSLEDCDLIATAATYPLRVRGYQLAVERMVEFDKDLIDALIRRGFKYDLGEDRTGHQMKYFRRGGGYYLDCGCSGLIIKGEVGLLQYDQIERFVAGGALLKDGSTVPADLLVLATGYYSQQELVRRMLGDAVASRVGQIWGFDADGELANMWKRTAQEGLWFMAGSLIQCRIYSKYLALQIKAIEEGLLQ
jgi:cation diffusion facilitator CzcD-associated flavoprotein CzcO